MTNGRGITLALRRRRSPRRGIVMVLFVICLIPLLACVAMAINIGMLTLANTQLKDYADGAALAGARALNGDSTNNNNYNGVSPAAQAAVTSNTVLGGTVSSSQLTLNIGRYTYNSTNQQFEGNFPGSTGNWNMVQATVTANMNNNLGFSKIFNLTLPNYQAVSTAAHRPRDVCLILDYSGSMRFSSLLGTPYTGDRSSNNQDTAYPTFGHYSAASSLIQASNASAPYGNANISTTTSDGRPPIVQDFYSNSTGTLAFSAGTATTASNNNGDLPLTTSLNSTSTYAKTVADITGSTSKDGNWESNGYNSHSNMNGTKTTWYGYTCGSGYWGKTFFIWPPDPRSGKDWRTTYLTISGGKADNTKIWNSSTFNQQVPSSTTYTLNYTAILNFIKNVGPCPFPSTLRSGRIVYYTSIPDSIDTSVWPPTDLNQRFWKDYIDYVMGVVQYGSSSWDVINDYTNNGYMGYGKDFQWGTLKISSPPGGQYMNYSDNPPRPLLKFWFGPLTMIDFLGNYNMWYAGYGNNCTRWCWWPGTCHESPMYACKLGIAAALSDVKNNHPSDYLSLIMFSTPQISSSDTSAARFNRVRVGLGQDYTSLNDSLWYPPSTVGNSAATVTPYDANNLEVPRAMGGTCYSIGLMLAYNQFSMNSNLVSYNAGKPAGDAGGNGRKGAQKIIIFETDGAPNTTASATFNNVGAYQGYYSVRYNSNNPSGSEFPSSVNGYGDSDPTVTSQIYTIIQNLAALDTSGGFNTAAHPLKLHCIAFGPQITSTALTTLSAMQTYGNVTDNMPSYKVINGTVSSMITSLQTAITNILQDGVQVSLIQ